jgi:CRISPR-associated endonuclease/helicase Cas3
MAEIAASFQQAFEALTGHCPFPWQERLFSEWFAKGRVPPSCNLPTGLGKTNVIAVWLIALANGAKVPRRLVYVVNRRTVVDQATHEVERLRENLAKAGLIHPLNRLCAFAHDVPLAISTLRGQFADNGEWAADPARPAIIVGTVDMIGSRLLFSGYGVGFRRKPLHAGFLGQDALLVHDEAHLEPAFQTLIEAIRDEQKREPAPFGEQMRLKVMELTATSRGTEEPFGLTFEEKSPPERWPDRPTEPMHFVWQRLTAKKVIHLHPLGDHKKLADAIADLAVEQHKDSSQAVLVFVQKVEDVEKIAKRLPKGSTEQLTGTLRGLERDGLMRKPILQRFLPESNRDKDVVPADGTVYLVCTSAGEVGIDISADHLVCDLTPFDSMAQRLGRVNRFGARDDTCIDVVHPVEFDAGKEFERRRKLTLELLRKLKGNGSPAALGTLAAAERLAAFTPAPAILPTTDILFDAWAMTSIRGKLPGRPLVEPYLHGIRDWEPPETRVAWREEVDVITDDLLERYKPQDLLDDYPLKPQELLRDVSSRVFDRLGKLDAPSEMGVWIVSDDGSVEVTSLGALIESGKDAISYKTVLLPPQAGGLEKGVLTAESSVADDVADEWRDDRGQQRRVRVWDDGPQRDETTKRMRLIRQIRFYADEDDEDAIGRSWLWFERPGAADNEGSKSAQRAVLWQVHTDDVANNADAIVGGLPLPDDVKKAVILAARFHDLGKRRMLFQRLLGNFTARVLLAKSGRKDSQIPELYRHEFGSLLDIQAEPEFQKQSDDMKDLILHLIAAGHGRGRPHFPADEAFDPEPKGRDMRKVAIEVPQRFARLQRRYGRWGLAHLESLLRAADYAASANPSAFAEKGQEDQS